MAMIMIIIVIIIIIGITTIIIIIIIISITIVIIIIVTPSLLFRRGRHVWACPCPGGPRTRLPHAAHSRVSYDPTHAVHGALDAGRVTSRISAELQHQPRSHELYRSDNQRVYPTYL